MDDLNRLPPDYFGIYKYYTRDYYVLWPHNIDKLVRYRESKVAYIPFFYRNCKVILKK